MAYLLIIMDDATEAEALLPVLTAEGHETKVLHHPENVLLEINNRRPDLLLLNLTRTENKTASIDLAKQIRRNSSLAGLPILLVTPPGDEYPFQFGPKDLDSAWFPVSGFVEKPVDPVALRRSVAELIRARSGRPA